MNRVQRLVGVVLLGILLLGCLTTGGGSAGQLTSERSQVFFRNSGQSAQELTQGGSRTLSDGDEAWTQSQGRALLKFSDLWLRLYDDTTLHADDVTPASIKLALGQGAALVGKAPAAAERVEITAGDPPTARIVIAGTLLMIAQPVRGGPTVVRLFGGVAAVTGLRTGEAERITAPGWAIIEPDGRIRRPDDDEVRQFARDRGWWDAFAEIEREAAGFGPPASRIPADRITLVFAEDGQTACARPPVLELAEPQVDGLTAVLDGRAAPGCADDPISKLVIEWGDGSTSTGGLPARHIYKQPGAYTIVVQAISERGRQTEAQRTVKLQASAPALPNLVVKIIQAPGKATCGQQLGDDVTAQVANTGKADAAGFYLGLYLSEDEKITAQDFRLSPPRPDGRTTPTARTFAASGHTYIEGLPAGKSLEIGLHGANQIPTSLPEGTQRYWLGIVVDDTAAVRESDEGDNAGPGWPIVIGCLK
jgi:hypothetical protein